MMRFFLSILIVLVLTCSAHAANFTVLSDNIVVVEDPSELKFVEKCSGMIKCKVLLIGSTVSMVAISDLIFVTKKKFPSIFRNNQSLYIIKEQDVICKVEP